MSRIAIVSAMAEELQGLKAHLSAAETVAHAGRAFWRGRLGPHEVVLALSGIGKVAAATTAAVLLGGGFGVSRIVFTGVAGGLGSEVKVGDVVVADALVQHDMDASPLFPRYEVPLYGLSHFPADAEMSDRLQAVSVQVLQPLQTADADALGTAGGSTSGLRREDLAAFGLAAPRVHRGLVLTGDRFVASAAESRRLREAFPAALAVEMEGAAVAQVCRDFGTPFAVLRVVSDRADDDAHLDFGRFIQDIANRYTVAMVLGLLAAG